MLLVEGESDCWTTWFHGIPALGVPGKSTWKSDWAPYLEGTEVYVWQEPNLELTSHPTRVEVPPGAMGALFSVQATGAPTFDRNAFFRASCTPEDAPGTRLSVQAYIMMRA